MKRYNKLDKGVLKKCARFFIATMEKHIAMSSPYSPPTFKIFIKKKTK